MGSIIKKFNKHKFTTVLVSVVLVFGGIAVNFLFGASIPENNLFGINTVFGGPKPAALTDNFEPSAGLLQDNFAPTDSYSKEIPTEETNLVYQKEALLTARDKVASGSLTDRGDILTYRIEKGDTLSKIAVSFDISLNTILWANSNLRVNALTPGEEIVILPVSGILHEVRAGENVQAIAKIYGVSAQGILSVNPKAVLRIIAGEKIIVPDGRPLKAVAGAASNLPRLIGYFALPASGKNWGQLHPENAVDIANTCGTPVFASAEGLVTDVGDPSNWNGGLGGSIEMEHPNKTGTRYAHLQSVLVSVGDYVEKGAKIAEMGNTGNVKGETGCHLHFEVHGARNPLAN